MEGRRPPIDLELLTTDAELLVCAQSGTPPERENAIELLSKRYLEVAFKSAVVILRNDDAANDAMQDAMVTFLIKLGTLDPSQSLQAWIATVSRNRAKSMRRVMWRVVQFGSDEEEDATPDREDACTPFDYASYSEMMRAIDGLPLKQRVVVERHLLEGEHVADIAHDLQLTPAAVYARLAGARKELGKFIGRKS